MLVWVKYPARIDEEFDPQNSTHFPVITWFRYFCEIKIYSDMVVPIHYELWQGGSLNQVQLESPFQ